MVATIRCYLLTRSPVRLLQVPFVGKDVPSQAAEFAHPEVLIGLTIMAYRYEGLRTLDIREIVAMLKQAAVREVGSYEHRKVCLQTLHS